MIVSIFNDVIGPVMRGPSSSHCAAALRIGRLARDLMSGEIDSVLVEFDNGGSLPATHASQGSDMGLFGGLLGWDADDERLPNSGQHLADAGIDLQFKYADLNDPHPNTYRLHLANQNTKHHLVAISVGGGMFQLIQLDGVDVRIDGDYYETMVRASVSHTESVREQLQADHVIACDDGLLQIKSQTPLTEQQLCDAIGEATDVVRLSPVLPVMSGRDVDVPFRSCEEMLAYNADRGLSLSDLAIEYEKARSGLTESQLIEKARQIVEITRASVKSGLAGTQYDDRVIGFQSGQFESKLSAGELLDAGILNPIVLSVTALMEVKSSMGVIVAAPTAGACAAFPAVCLVAGEKLNLDDDQIARAIMAGGIIGVFIATHWSFAAEVGGCQAEGGSASAMSAATLVSFAGGTAEQAAGAASMAMQNMLGLICDPVANRVEVPCLGKNVMAASNAISCANMALSGFDCVIPFDETVAAAKAVAERMPREHRCTALGGLSTTPTSLKIQERLAKGCGSGCGCGVPTTRIETNKQKASR